MRQSKSSQMSKAALSSRAAFLCLALLALACNKAKGAVDSLFVFGDDWVDTGSTKFSKNTWRPCGVPPFGASQTVGNGRCSDGALFIDQLAKQLKLGSPGPYFGPAEYQNEGIDFASPGACALDAYNPKGPTSMAGQLTMFKYWRTRNTNMTLSKSLVVVSFGMNDYMQALVQGDDPVPLTDQIVPKIVDIITQIQNISGAYRFLVISIPPIGCIPLMRENFSAPNSSCLTNLNALSDNHDSRLKYYLDKLSEEKPNGVPIYYSMFSVSKQMLSPAGGMTAFTIPWKVACGQVGNDGTVYQCGQLVAYEDPMTSKKVSITIGANKVGGYSYWWWDWINPTQDAHFALYVSLWSDRNETTYPMNTMTLSSC